MELDFILIYCKLNKSVIWIFGMSNLCFVRGCLFDGVEIVCLWGK